MCDLVNSRIRWFNFPSWVTFLLDSCMWCGHIDIYFLWKSVTKINGHSFPFLAMSYFPLHKYIKMPKQCKYQISIHIAMHKINILLEIFFFAWQDSFKLLKNPYRMKESIQYTCIFFSLSDTLSTLLFSSYKSVPLFWCI